MPAAARLGDLCTGHGCWPPREGVSASPNVFINGIQAHRLNDPWFIHCCDSNCHDVVASGSGTVYINGLPAARMGDSISCGSLISEGSPNVHIGSRSVNLGRRFNAGNYLTGAIDILEDFGFIDTSFDFGDFF
jgi:uncharacterized Zn-binding protein involved in type VI secretion